VPTTTTLCGVSGVAAALVVGVSSAMAVAAKVSDSAANKEESNREGFMAVATE
jgi:hypothetical protein